MAGASTKRVEVVSESGNTTSLAGAKDGSAFAKCEECNKDVPVAVIGFHSCGLDAIIQMKMKMEAEVLKPVNEGKKKPTARKKATSTEPDAKKPKTETANNNKKKRPTAFFIFMADFRKEYKEANPDSKLIKEVSKQAGEKWKSMTDEEKKYYQDKAALLKADFDKPSETKCEEN